MLYSKMVALVTSSRDQADDSSRRPLSHSPHVNDLHDKKLHIQQAIHKNIVLTMHSFMKINAT